MARELHAIEKGLRLLGENSNVGVNIIFGSGLPGGDTGEQDASEIGSLYIRTNGEIYQKKTNLGNASDWELNGASQVSIGTFRPEKVIAATGQVAPSSGGSINLTTNPFSDDEGTLLTSASFAIGDHVIFGVGGIPKLMRVSAIAAPSVTFVDATTALMADDAFVVKNYLPDTPAGQEGSALVVYSDGNIIKLSDVDWSLANGISLLPTIADANGPVAGSDTLQVAIEKLEGDSKDAAVLSGVARGAVDLGTFTGSIIPDASTIKSALQSIETNIETSGRASAAAITALTVVDEVLVDEISLAKWYVLIEDAATPANKVGEEVLGMHNGTAAADASLVDDTVYSKLKLGASFNHSVVVALSGAGPTQKMQLKVASTLPGGVNVKVYREFVK